ncbi:MAG: YDG domain-containing protein [Bacteroidales bacterium]
MKTSLLTILFFLIILSVKAQKPEANIYQASVAPLIDGTIDAVWAEATAYNIALPFVNEKPTLGNPGETTWKALWGDEGLFILLQVTDNVFSPCYYGSQDCYDYQFDKMELYFDCNEVLEDGGGGQFFSSNGHYQVAEGYNEGWLDGGEMIDANRGIRYAHVLNNPNVVWEYFIPWSYLLDKDGNLMNLSSPMGFDVTINDNDTPGIPDRRRAVWSNDGNGNIVNESWNTMDGCGIINFVGVPSPILVTGIAINSSENSIKTDNGSLQMEAVVSPSNATNQLVQWTVENISGRAKISENGLLTALNDGTVKVIAKAKDESGIQAEKIISITDQMVFPNELNLIRNGTFDLDGPGFPQYWSGWLDGAGQTISVIGNVANLDPNQYNEVWHYQFYQTGNDKDWYLYNDTSYIVMFDAWSDVARTITFDFEDSPENFYTRYGDSQDENAVNGTSEWNVDITTIRATYTQTFTCARALQNTIHKIQFNLSGDDNMVYLDNIALYSIGDYERAQVLKRTTLSTNRLFHLWTDSARVEASILGITGDNLLQHGLCWGTSPQPTIAGSKTALGERNSLGKFTSLLTGLSPATKYYVRAYATDSQQTVYGNDLQIYTAQIPVTVQATPGQSKVYGNADPAQFAYTISAGSVMSGIPLQGALDRAEGNIPGTYPIGQGTLTGENNPNYTLSFVSADFTIAPRPLTITGTKAMNKVYDGNTNASLIKGTLSGVLKGDTVIFQAGAAHFADNKVGYKAVTVDGYSMQGGQVVRYTYTFPSTSFMASITPAALSITGLTVKEKQYDGTVFAELMGGSFQHVVQGDSVVMIRGTGKFGSKNAGNNISIYITGFNVGGPDSANYNVTQPQSIQGNITPAPLVVKAENATRPKGTPNPFFTLVYSGFIQKEDESVLDIKPIAWCAADTNSPPGNYDILVSGGLDNNYALFYLSGTLKVTDGTGVGENQLNGLSIFPNPVTEHFILHIDGCSSEVVYQLFNQQGRMVIDGILNIPETEVRMDGMADGLYLVRIFRNGQVIGSKRVIKISK